MHPDIAAVWAYQVESRRRFAAARASTSICTDLMTPTDFADFPWVSCGKLVLLPNKDWIKLVGTDAAVAQAYTKLGGDII